MVPRHRVTPEEIAEIVRAIAPHDALEQAHINHTLTWIASGAPLYRTRKPATPAQHLVAYFVLLDRQQDKILLVHHKKSGLWLPSGGHVEPDEHPAATVARELMEELQGQAEFLFFDPLFLTVTQTVGNVAQHTDVSLWYMLHGDCTQPLDFDTEEFHTVAWYPLVALPSPAKMDPQMLRFRGKLRRHIALSSPVT